MPKGLPPLDPRRQSGVDQLHAGATDLLDHYLKAFEVDMNRHVVKHGPMDEGRAIYDMTMLFREQMRKGELPANMVAAMLATAIVRGIAGKRKGKGDPTR